MPTRISLRPCLAIDSVAHHQLADDLPMVRHHLAAFEDQFQLAQMVNVI
jgi:hypothetical protein